jgi:hypothetical protein
MRILGRSSFLFVAACALLAMSWHVGAQANSSAATKSTESASTERSEATVPPGYSMMRTGNVHDFDYLIGAWTTQQKRLKARGVGSTEWIEAPANKHCAVSYLDGTAIVDESRLPTNAAAGLFLYTFNPGKGQWSIFWVNPKTGQPDPPDLGGFTGSRGEFYADDVDNGRPIKVRIIWTTLDHDHARWEQAFSFDNRTWETNWISDMTRADPSVICQKP